MSQPFTVVVEGNIGSGKSTFLEHFKTFPGVCTLEEPVSKWRNLNSQNLLDLVYKDPVKYSMCFQSYVQLTMLQLHMKDTMEPVKIIERSVFSAQYCFNEELREKSVLSGGEFAVLSEWFDFLVEKLPFKVDLIVYLRTKPEVAYTRIRERGRFEEQSITLDYIESIHKRHEDWLVHKRKPLPCPVITIDANVEMKDMTNSYKLFQDDILNLKQKK